MLIRAFAFTHNLGGVHQVVRSAFTFETVSSGTPSLVHEAPSSLVATVLAIALCLIELLVESLCPPLDTEAEKDSAQASEQDESTSESVEGLLAGREEVGREPVRALADTVCNGDQSCFLAARRGDQGCLPGKLQVETVVSTCDKKACSEVASTDVGCRDQDGGADCGRNDRDYDVVA